MSAWMNDAAVPNHNGHGFPHMNDPSAAAPSGAMMDPSAFMAGQGQFNPAQFAQSQGQQQQQQPQQPQPQQPQPQQPQMVGMQNGPMRNASPSFQNPVYQTNPVIPAKRSRPREDSIAGSPRQNPGMPPTSRSETPQQQAFPGFQPAAGMPQQNPGQFPHLQPNGSANASPSPIMGSQMRPGSVPQRVATASPHPYSPSTQQQYATQPSPVPSEHGTPQPNPYMNMPPGFNPNFAPSPSNPRPSPNQNPAVGGQMMPQQMGQMPQHMGQMPNNMYAQMQQQQQQQHHSQQMPPQPQQSPVPQRQQQPHNPQQHPQTPVQPRSQGMSEQQKMAMYKMRQMQQGSMQMQQAQMQAQQMGRGMIAQQPMMPGMPNGQMPPGAMRPQQRTPMQLNPEGFMKNLAGLMASKGLPLDQNPMVGDRPVHLMYLFQLVHSKGGHRAVTTGNAWGQVAQSLGLPAHIPTVPPTLKSIYERNLQTFEDVWQASQKQRSMAVGGPQQGTPQKQMQSHPQMNQGQMQAGPQQQQSVAAPQTPMKPAQGPVNGFPTPQPPPQPLQQASISMPGHNRTSMTSGPDEMTGMSGMPSPEMGRAGNFPFGQSPGLLDPYIGGLVSMRPDGTIERGRARQDPNSDEYQPNLRDLLTIGGVNLNTANGMGQDLDRFKPDAPAIQDLGHIDVAALTRSLQCGIQSEVRLALDTLATVSNTMHQSHMLHLRFCDDLVEVLVDFAEDQLDILAEATAEVSDEIQLTPYEDLMRLCRFEHLALHELSRFGDTDYQLDRAVDKLSCVMTILRNMSFGAEPDNQAVLGEEPVINLLCSVIRYLGTRTMLLRTQANTLDFMKDCVILLSNVAGSVEIAGREQAMCLLQFLLAFATSPVIDEEHMSFSPYDPTLHPYLPHAVDALAKLLARDEPNRTFYKAIFAMDGSSLPPYDLLTRTFALALAPIPDKFQEWTRYPGFPPLIEARKPFLMQGLLSAEILASLTPGSESGLALALLSSGDGLGQQLLSLARELSQVYDHQAPMQQRGNRHTNRKDPELVYIVVLAISLLRRLAEKARDFAGKTAPHFADLLPTTELLMEALTLQSAEWTKEGLLQQLTALTNMAR